MQEIGPVWSVAPHRWAEPSIKYKIGSIEYSVSHRWVKAAIPRAMTAAKGASGISPGEPEANFLVRLELRLALIYVCGGGPSKRVTKPPQKKRWPLKGGGRWGRPFR